MRMGLLQCGAVPEPLRARHGDYPDLYSRLLGPGFEWQVFRAFEGDVPDDPGVCDGWLVSGSRFGAYENHDWVSPLEDLLRAIQGDRPLVGICFGHQIIAQALGGRVEKFDGGWAVGRRAYDWNGDSVYLNAWHQDQVVAPPDAAETIAWNGFTAHAGFRIGPRTLTIQPHPEFSAGYIADMICRVAPGKVPGDLLEAARRDLARPIDNAATGRRLAAFLRSA